MELLNDIAIKYDIPKRDASYILDMMDAPKERKYVKNKADGGVHLVHYEVPQEAEKRFKRMTRMRKELLPALEMEYCSLNKRTLLPMMILRASIEFLFDKKLSITEIGLTLRKHHSTVIHHLKVLRHGNQHRLYPLIKKDVYQFLEEKWKS